MESESHASRIVSAIKIYDTLERSALKIHPRVFVSCSRAKGCNFCGLLTFCSETFLEKLSLLYALRNYGDRCGKLRRVRKHESHPAASLRIRQFKRSGTGSVRVSAQGLVSILQKAFTTNILSTRLTALGNPWVSEDGFKTT